MKLDDNTKNKIINFFKDKKEVEAVYLYGSYAKETAREDSDIDLAVIVSDENDFEGFDMPQTRYNYDLGKLTGKKIEVQNLESVAIDFAHRVLYEGELLMGLGSKKRVDFEEMVLRVYFDMKPAIEEYFYYLRKIAKKGELGVRYI